jgi:hypothetical protein
MRRAAVFTFVAAAVVFCGVQDRITAAGARRYVAVQRAALAGEGPLTTIDAIVRPAVRRSVEQGLLWSGAAAGTSAAVIALWGRRHRRG